MRTKSTNNTPTSEYITEAHHHPNRVAKKTEATLLDVGRWPSNQKTTIAVRPPSTVSVQRPHIAARYSRAFSRFQSGNGGTPRISTRRTRLAQEPHRPSVPVPTNAPHPTQSTGPRSRIIVAISSANANSGQSLNVNTRPHSGHRHVSSAPSTYPHPTHANPSSRTKSQRSRSRRTSRGTCVVALDSGSLTPFL